MATLAALKKQMAALEAKLVKATKAEMGGAIAKVHKIMSDFGLTIEHISSSAPKSRSAVTGPVAKTKRGAKAAAKGGSKPPKYQDPSTGVTWAGVGRAPAWIVNAKDREAFLISKPAFVEATADRVAVRKAPKQIASVKRSMAAAAAKKASRKSAVSPDAAEAAAPAKRAASKKVAAKKATGKKAAVTKAAARKSAGARKVAAAPAKKSAGKNTADRRGAGKIAADAPASEAGEASNTQV